MRQPVKGKPHIRPCLLQTVASAPRAAEFYMHGDNWAKSGGCMGMGDDGRARMDPLVAPTPGGSMSRTNTYLRELPHGLTHIDVYWVLRLFNVTDPCAQHAVKKLLADGSGDKDRAENMREAWETLDRWVEMENESTPKELRQHHPDGLTRWIEKTRQQSESIDPWLQPERQEQVRERHDIVPDERLNRPVPAGWRPIATAPTDGTEVEVLTDEVDGLLPVRAIVSYHPDAGWAVDELRPTLYWRPIGGRLPPDRPLASHCPDGGACRHKCGLEPCKEASE